MARLPPVPITADGQPTVAQTDGHGHATAVLLTTAIADLALTLTSIYLGAGTGQTLVAHLVQAPGQPRVHSELVDADQLPVTHARERCLLEHAGALQHAASQLGHILAIDLTDAALAAAGKLYDPAA